MEIVLGIRITGNGFRYGWKSDDGFSVLGLEGVRSFFMTFLPTHTLGNGYTFYNIRSAQPAEVTRPLPHSKRAPAGHRLGKNKARASTGTERQCTRAQLKSSVTTFSYASFLKIWTSSKCLVEQFCTFWRALQISHLQPK